MGSTPRDGVCCLSASLTPKAILVAVCCLGAANTLTAATVPVASPAHRGIVSLVPSVPTFHVYFANGQTELGPAQQPALDQIAAGLDGFAGLVVIEGFDALGGSEGESFEASKARASSVESYLKETGRGSKASFITLAYGSRYARVATPSDDQAGARLVTVTLVQRKAAKAVKAALQAARDVMADEPQPKPKMEAPPPQPPRPVPNAPPLDGRSGLRVLYIYAPTTPASYRKLAYDGPGQSGAAHSDASPGRVPAALGGGVEWQGFRRSGLGYAAGLRYRRYAEFESEATFAPQANGHDVVTRTTATAYGGWIDVFPLQSALTRRFSARCGPGLDVDYSTVQVAEVYRDERVAAAVEGTEHEATSRLAVVSARVASGVSYGVGSVAAGVNVNVQLPVWSSEARTEADEDADGWQRDLDHRSAVGSEVALGLAYKF